MRHPKLLLPVALLAAAAAAAAFAFSRARVSASPVADKPAASTATVVAAQSPHPLAHSAGGEYVRRGRLRPALRGALGALGDRLERPGKERLTATGTISRPGSDPVPFALALDSPGRLHLELQGAWGRRVVTFDERAAGARPELTAEDAVLVETLAYDTAERFFTLQARGAATRFLGTRFRLDDGSDASSAGPYYDVYQVTDRLPAGAGERAWAKLYHLNSDTLLVERVRYGVERGGRRITAEVVLSNWRQVAGQRVPGRVERTEDGEPVLTVTFDSVALGPRGAGGSTPNP